MGFRDARELVIGALRSGQFDHERRVDIHGQNLLYSGEVDPPFVIGLLLRCTGWEYGTSRHHWKDVDCHIFTPAVGGERWYIKAYLQNALVVFISVHP